MTVTPESKEAAMIRRAGRLKFLTEQFQGRWNRVLEIETYLVLESHQTRRQALLRYLRFAISEYWFEKTFDLRWRWKEFRYQFREPSKRDLEVSDMVDAWIALGKQKKEGEQNDDGK